MPPPDGLSLEPVDHDPFAAGQFSSADIASMTHQAPDTSAKPAFDAAFGTLHAFLTGGLQGVANLRGTNTPDWSKNLGAVLSSPEANAALGMTAPVGASPLLRQGVSYGRAGRATQTSPLPIGTEPQILERAQQRLGEGPRIVSKNDQQDILRQNWEAYGPQRDWDFDNFKTWDREVKQWNKDYPDNPMPTGDYRFGSNPAFEQMFNDKHLAGKKAPFPGAKLANQHFEDDPENWQYTAYTSVRQIPDEMMPSNRQAMARTPLGQDITAFHGSPHDFDAFDMSKIGTGEGAQAYGHGLYFAENEGVARQYREALAGVPSAKFAGDADYPFAAASKAVREFQEKNPLPSYLSSARGDIQNSVVRHMTLDAPGDEKALADYVDQVAGTYPVDAQSQIRQWANETADIVRPHLEINRPGKMYQVSINADPEHFLDWDKTIGEHSNTLKNKLANVPFENEGGLQEILQSEAKGDTTGFGVHHLIQQMEHAFGPEQSTQKLREAGIPGIRYLDQGSRPAPNQAQLARELDLHQQMLADAQQSGDSRRITDAQSKIDAIRERMAPSKPTSNYVVFDDKLISIMKKYGIAGISALPGLGAYHFQTDAVDHDPFAGQ